MTPTRFVLAQIYLLNPHLDEDDPKLNSGKPEGRWVQSSIDLWAVKEVNESYEKNEVDLEYYDGDVKTVKGKFSEWYDKHVSAKNDELQLIRFPALN